VRLRKVIGLKLSYPTKTQDGQQLFLMKKSSRLVFYSNYRETIEESQKCSKVENTGSLSCHKKI